MDGSELRQARERLELSVDQFAAELDVSPEMLRRWEQSKATVPRQQAKGLPAQVARLERERQRMRRTKHRARGRKRERTSRVVLLAPFLLLVAGGIGYLPTSNAWLILLYPLSLAVGGILLLNVYDAVPGLRRAGALGRWMARCIAGSVAMVGFIGIYLVSGYGAILTADEPLSFTTAILLGVVSGVLYATMWPVGKWMHGY